MSKIPNQVKLPISVAFEVVMQGIRIRIGRSMVTITGVICGIGFLMSILTGMIIKKGVRAEDSLRAEVSRMTNFIKAEMPTLQDKSIFIKVAGTLSEVEMRLLEKLKEQGVKTLEIDGLQYLQRPMNIAQNASEPSQQAAVFFVLGAKTWPTGNWASLLGKRCLGTTLPKEEILPVPKDQLIMLSRIVTEADKAKALATAKQDRFRSIWIGIVSVLVTVIGITNAMLMSVTERFREIGTMKCLGSLSSFIRQIFLLESSLMGLAGGIIGALLGSLFSICVYALTYGGSLVFSSLDIVPLILNAFIAIIAGIGLSIIAALYPARVASNMVPAHALRSNV